jgi:hypothetical protein
MNMSQVHVFDTYARTQKGRILHFDVVIPEKDPALALTHAKDWLARIGEEGATVSQENCVYCHSETTAPDFIVEQIARRGYGIMKLEGCPRDVE